MAERKRVSIEFSGNVQGVGFRYTARNTARQYRVTGHVRNLYNGNVEIIAEGDADEVEAFIAAVKERMGAHIRGEQRHTGPANGEFPEFRVAF